MPQETYDLLSLPEDYDEERGPDTVYAPLENMLSAAQFITSLLSAQKIQPVPSSQKPQQTESSTTAATSSPKGTYAILGGFSIQLRGGRMSTRDIDLVTTVSMRNIWKAILGNERLVIPSTRLFESLLKIFIKTGSPWDACPTPHLIEVDIKQAGTLGSPRSLTHKTEAVGPFALPNGEEIVFEVLDIPSMMKIKVECCLGREERRDFEDVGWMIGRYGEVVRRAVEEGVLDGEEVGEVLRHEKMGGVVEEGNGEEMARVLGLEGE